MTAVPLLEKVLDAHGGRLAWGRVRTIEAALSSGGLASMRGLPIAQYPEIAPPVVTVRAVYPGASAEVLEQTVAAPLENAITGIEKMIYMSSTSTSQGVVEIQVTFDIGANVDQAALTVNNRVKQAEPRLPQEVRRQGVTVEKGSSAFLQVLAFYSPDGTRDDLFTSNYVTLNVLDALKRVPGTNNVQIFGAKDYAMRIWVKPDRMTQLKLTTAEVTRAITEQNAQFVNLWQRLKSTHNYRVAKMLHDLGCYVDLTFPSAPDPSVVDRSTVKSARRLPAVDSWFS